MMLLVTTCTSVQVDNILVLETEMAMAMVMEMEMETVEMQVETVEMKVTTRTRMSVRKVTKPDFSPGTNGTMRIT